MGIIKHGANGGFSGKAGSVVGSSWKNVAYIKGLPKRSKKAPSEKQLNQRAKFAVAVNFLMPVVDLINMGFKKTKAVKASPFNVAVQHTLQHAIMGTYPDYSIDFTQLQFSKGALQKASSLTMAANQPGELEFSWSKTTNKLNAYADDNAVILLYNKQQDLFLSYTEMATRADGGFVAEIPEDFLGQDIAAYLFFVSRENDRISTSVFAGEMTVN